MVATQLVFWLVRNFTISLLILDPQAAPCPSPCDAATVLLHRLLFPAAARRPQSRFPLRPNFPHLLGCVRACVLACVLSCAIRHSATRAVAPSAVNKPRRRSSRPRRNYNHISSSRVLLLLVLLLVVVVLLLLVHPSTRSGRRRHQRGRVGTKLLPEPSKRPTSACTMVRALALAS